MAYEKQMWTDNDASTPLSAERLNHMEDGIEAGNVEQAAPAGYDAVKSAIDGATYSVNADTLIKRNSQGSFSVPTGEPQYNTSPTSKGWVNDELAKRDKQISDLTEQVKELQAKADSSAAAAPSDSGGTS